MSDSEDSEGEEPKDIDWETLLANYANDPEANLDPRVVADASKSLSEEHLIGTYSTDGNNEERLPLVKSWFPQEDEWQGKTHINSFQAKALAVAKHLPDAFNELKPLAPFMENVINDYEMLLTSVEGKSREQQMNVLMSMFGEQMGEESKARSALLSAIAGKETENGD